MVNVTTKVDQPLKKKYATDFSDIKDSNLNKKDKTNGTLPLYYGLELLHKEGWFARPSVATRFNDYTAWCCPSFCSDYKSTYWYAMELVEKVIKPEQRDFLCDPIPTDVATEHKDIYTDIRNQCQDQLCIFDERDPEEVRKE